MSAPLSPQLSAPNPPCLPYPLPFLPPIRASTAVYQVPELRTQIIRQLGRRDQATMMRAQKKGMALVARELYHTILYEVAETRLQVSTERHQVYNDSVIVIDARDLSLTPSMIQQLHLDDDALVPEGQTKEQYLARWPEEYHPELLQLIIPPFRRAFPKLRTILLGSHYSPFDTTSWGVELEPPSSIDEPETEVPPLGSAPADSSGDVGSLGRGHISHFKTRYYRANKTPPDIAQLNKRNPKPPSDQYTIHTRYDLRLYVSDRDLPLASPAAQRWTHALSDERLFVNLYRTVRIDCVPVTIGTLKSFYQRQVDAGFVDRLQTILVHDVLPFTIPDLQSFARIAAASLTHLSLCKPWKSGDGAGNTLLSAAHLPQIVAIVREDLPKLRSLRFAMCGIAEAESTCRGFLNEHTLRPGGNLHTLQILTDPCATTLFNTLRCLSPMLRDYASVCILGSAKEEGEFLAYLRKQPLHLSIIDFSTIGVRTLPDVKDVTYERDGKPRHILYGKAETWGAAASSAARLAREEVTYKLNSCLRDLEEATRQLIPKSTTKSTATTVEITQTGSTISTTTITTITTTGSYGAVESELHLLKQMQLQLDAVAKVETAAVAMNEILGTARRTAESVKKEMRGIQDARAAREAAQAQAAEAGSAEAVDVEEADSSSD